MIASALPNASRFSAPLPIDEVLGPITAALEQNKNVVLVAPPGAGKSTRLPLSLLDADRLQGQKIILVVPRRLAALGAAKRMAGELGEPVGQTIGHRVRFDTRVGPATRLEVVTAGVFTRLISADPELAGTGLVIFDEVHERALAADLGLAFAMETRTVLRPDLPIIAMSATLDGARFEAVLSTTGPCQQITSEGATYPVEMHHWPSDKPTVEAVVEAATKSLARFDGDGLIFLPGQREIEAAARSLEELLGQSVAVHRLYGAVARSAQDEAIKPDSQGRRKLVVASSIAETSLTIPGVMFVIDSGLARRPIYDPARGITRLETQAASRAAIDQRKGRAGRTAAGHCVRLWRKEEEGGRPAQDRAEILDADLSPLRLEMAAWGATARDSLTFLDPPPKGAWQQAGVLLADIGAIDSAGVITELGKCMARQPLHPRLSAMMERATPEQKSDAAWAAVVASELSERGPLDATERLSDAMRQRGQKQTLKTLHNRFAKGEPLREPPDAKTLARHLVAAFPDRVAQRQKDDGQRATYKLAHGNQCVLDLHHPLAQQRYLVVIDLGGGRKTGKARLADIRLALLLEERWLHDWLSARITSQRVQVFDAEKWAVQTSRKTTLGALVLAAEPGPKEMGLHAVDAIADHLRDSGLEKGLRLDKSTGAVMDRFEAFLQSAGGPNGLLERIDHWLPTLLAVWVAPPFSAGQLNSAFLDSLTWDEREAFNKAWPSHVELADGQKAAIQYDHPAGPAISVKPKALYGTDAHPTFGPHHKALVIELLSPAQRPIALTSDLPAFWRAGWADVRKDMRARYPKHTWPAEPWKSSGE